MSEDYSQVAWVAVINAYVWVVISDPIIVVVTLSL